MPPPPPPVRKMPPPPPRKKLELAKYWNETDFLGTVFINSHSLEPMEVSLKRLEDTIIADGAFDYICPAAVWYAYKRHPELHQLLPNQKLPT